jgi:hypothetical protein
MDAVEFPISVAAGYLWWNCLPAQWAYTAKSFKKASFPVDNALEVDSKQVALKFNAPQVHMSGILGAEFIRDDSDVLSIEIYVNDSRQEVRAVHAGLPEEFANTVLEESLKTLKSFSGGKIIVRHAAWDEIDSSFFTFKVLARSLMKLFLFDSMNKEFADVLVRTTMHELRQKK